MSANGTQPNFAKGKEVNGVDASPKHFKLAMASRRAVLSGNTSLIDTFYSLVFFVFLLAASVRTVVG